MHVLIVTTYFPPDSGAAAVRLGRLGRMLASRGHKVTVLTAMPHYPSGRVSPKYRGRFSIRESVEGMEINRVWLLSIGRLGIAWRLLGQLSFMVSAFLKGLTLQRADIMLIEAQPMFTNFAGCALAFVKEVPYVQNISDLWPDHLLSTGTMSDRNPVYVMLRILTNATYRNATQIVAMSPAWAKSIVSRVRRKTDVRVIYNGVDLQRFSPLREGGRYRSKLGLPQDKMLLTFVGAFTTQNDFETIFSAISLLLHRDDFVFLLVGAGSQDDLVKNWAERLASEEKAGAVRTTGWISHEEIPEVWAASDISLIAFHDKPLYAGTIPAKYFEAFASGVPIVAAVPGLAADMLRESGAGLATPCGDVHAYSSAIAQLLDNKLLRMQMGSCGREYAKTHFDPTQNTAAYESVLAESARRG